MSVFNPFRMVIFGLTTLAITAPALAQDLPNLRQARRLIFAEQGAVEGEVIPHPSLSDAELAILEQLVQTQSYYAAVAIAPGMGLASQATIAAANYHDEENARIAALAACNAARDAAGDDGSDCVVVLVIRPEGWEPRRSLQLNSEASAALRRDYRRIGRGRVMAISDSTGNWGMGEGEAAALADCGEADCRAVVRN
jgi:hypothetical protein